MTARLEREIAFRLWSAGKPYNISKNLKMNDFGELDRHSIEGEENYIDLLLDWSVNRTSIETEVGIMLDALYETRRERLIWPVGLVECQPPDYWYDPSDHSQKPSKDFPEELASIETQKVTEAIRIWTLCQPGHKSTLLDAAAAFKLEVSQVEKAIGHVYWFRKSDGLISPNEDINPVSSAYG